MKLNAVCASLGWWPRWRSSFSYRKPITYDGDPAPGKRRVIVVLINIKSSIGEMWVPMWSHHVDWSALCRGPC